ncbi:PEP-utilizing enzyme [Chitinophaga sp.]|uniref:PEP-utilizing enzyme n=1 Tax=Chitinophaga sp. TaxID=1869181 RepID=UPI00262909D6|nr:PEP-utilizing enzyme [uncultured Chitinophaga sp.]
MRTAGGRLFVDLTPMLAAPASRQKILETLGQSDLLMKDALLTIINRGDFIPAEGSAPITKGLPPAFFQPPIGNDPNIVPGLIQRSQQALAQLKQDIQTKSGPALLDFIKENCSQLQKELTEPQNLPVILTAMGTYNWLNEKMAEWLGVQHAGDTLSLSAPGNVTAEMGLELLDVADLIRPFPAILAHLQQPGGSTFPEDLLSFEGGESIVRAVREFLDRYGMRCPGEIDITKTRWAENPSALIPLLLANIRNTSPGESKRKFEQGKLASEEMERSLLERLRALPEGEAKAAETKRMIDLLRSYTGYREYPKYAMISRYFIYKQALLREAETLVQAGVLEDKEDMYFLSFEELHEVIATQQLDASLIRERKASYRHYEKLTPPRVITSDGEILNGTYHRDQLPPGALAGLPVSPGTVEGRARVILQMESADLQPGDILVTAFTDPSWTPMFVTIKGLVTEVGGLMTHGAVIAREYGLPAVVAVDGATRLIKDGQRIRINGTDGIVEILED